MSAHLVAGKLITPTIRLVRQIGAGGMGILWVADHLTLHSQVVVKFISQALAEDSSALERFSREAAAASQVKSPHVVQIFDHGVTDGVAFIVMELLEGQDLAGRLDQHGALPPEEVGEIVWQVTKALRRAHAHGIVHRDVKPQNIFLCESEGGETFAKLLDFGIAKGGSAQVGSNTLTGTTMGSPHYMSPEQVVDTKGIDHRADLWSLGVVAFEALTNRRCFEGETVGGIHIAIHSGPIPLPSKLNPNVSPAVDAWFKKACTRNRDERFQSAQEMGDEARAAFLGQTSRRSTGRSSVVGHGGGRVSSDSADSDLRSAAAILRTADPLSMQATQVAPVTPAGVPSGSVAMSHPLLATTTPGAKRPLRLPMIAVGGVVAVILAVGVGVWARGRAPATREQLPSSPAPPSVTAPVTPSVVPSAVVSAVQPVSSVAPALESELKISASPSGAKLSFDGETLATNPFNGRFKRDGTKHIVRAELGGFVTRTTEVILDRDVVVVAVPQLEKAAAGYVPPPKVTAAVTTASPVIAPIATTTPTAATTTATSSGKIAPIDRDSPYGGKSP